MHKKVKLKEIYIYEGANMIRIENLSFKYRFTDNILENVKLKSSINNRNINENIIKQLECLNEELKFGNKNEKPYSLVNYMSYNKNFYAIYFKTYDSTGIIHRYIFFDVKRNKIKNYYLIDSTNKIIKQEEFIKVLKTYI